MANSEESKPSSTLVPSPIVDNEELENDESTSDSSNPHHEPNIQAVQTQRSTGLWFFTLLNLALLIAVFAAGIWYYMNFWQQDRQQQSDVLNAVEGQQAVVDSITSSQANIERRITDLSSSSDAQVNNLASALEESQALVAQLQQQLSETQLKLAEIGGRRPADWLLAEADYLVRMAGRKLWLENDDRSALMLLTAADSRLADLNDSSLIPIRALLAEDIQTIQQLNPISLTSVALSISGMIPQVNNLPIAIIKLPVEEDEPASTEITDSVADWRTNLKNTWQAIKDDLYTVRTSDKPIEPVMSAQAQWLTREQLGFALIQAKTAALRGDSTLYQQSLQRAIGIVVDDFELSDVLVKQFTAALQNLQQTNVERRFPQELKVQQPLKDKLNERINSLFERGDSAI